MRKLKEKRRRVEREYACLAPVYDRKWRSYINASTRETMARISTYGAGRILDVGCGTGVLLECLERDGAGTFLVGIDPVPSMLAVARYRLRGRVSLATGWAESLPARDEAFDTLISCNVFHYVEWPTMALQEAVRVLVPGGHLILTDWCADFLQMRSLGLYLRIRRRPLHRVYRAGELSRLLESAGFQSARIERFRVDRFWGLMTATVRK